MNEEEIRQIVRDEVRKNAYGAQFNVVPIPAHAHTGVDSSRINYDNLEGVIQTDITPERGIKIITTTGNIIPITPAMIEFYDSVGDGGILYYANADANFYFEGGYVFADNLPSVSNGTAAPATTPHQVGDIFVDKTGKKIYVATGVASSADWTIVN